MKNDVIITNSIASILILLGTLCYFALKPNYEIRSSDGPINIVVNNHGYQPAMIQIPAGKQVKLHITRENMEACKTGVEFPQLNAAFPFMLDIPINVTLPPQAPGMVDFNCQGGSARGRIVIV